MADGVRITFRNKDKLLAKLDRLAPGIAGAVKAVNGEAAAAMAGYARDFVPVRTGALRDSIVVTPPGGVPPGYSQGARVVPPGSYMVTAGNSKVRYAHLVEFGTAPHVNAGRFAGTQNPGARQQPFFWPSYRLIRKQMRSRAKRAVNRAVKAVAAQ